jgi:ATP-dependent helicase/nuclease subunit A
VLGSAAHEALAAVYRKLVEEGLIAGDRTPSAAPAMARASEILGRVWPEELEAAAGPSYRRLRGLFDLLGERWLASLAAFVEEDLQEIESEGGAAIEIEQAVAARLDLADGLRLLVEGRLDRILSRRDAVRVDDYKSGKSFKKRAQPVSALRGIHLQLSLYREAVAARRTPVPAVRARLLGVGPDCEEREAELELSSAEREGVLETVAAAVRLARGGVFPLFPSDGEANYCSWCGYRRTCRKDHEPTLSRIEGDPDLRDLRDVRSKTKKAPSSPRSGAPREQHRMQIRVRLRLQMRLPAGVPAGVRARVSRRRDRGSRGAEGSHERRAQSAGHARANAPRRAPGSAERPPRRRGPRGGRARLAPEHRRHAGAGTGKTSLLVERMLHQILERGIPLERMVAITFTVKAAAELQDRLEDALERVAAHAVEADRAGRVGTATSEADRVLARLDPAVRKEARRRALDALEAIPGAALGTIHSFAAELLRRHHRAAGVDVTFDVDDGEGAAELFEELWARFIEESLGASPAERDAHGGRPQGWRPLLGKVSLETVEKIARRLAGFGIPREVLGEGAEAAQREQVRAIAERAAGEIRSIRSAVGGATGLNARLLPLLDDLEAAYAAPLEGEPPASRIERITQPHEGGSAGASPSRGTSRLRAEDFPESCAVGARSSVPEEDRKVIEADLKRLVKGIKALAETDAAIAGELAACIGPFVERFRREYLRRGFVSYDGLVVLARDLLRDHADVRLAEGNRYDQILVDEFQDTDPLQYEIVFFLAEEAEGISEASGHCALERDAYRSRLVPGKVFIVGDAKQSIYHFRGADIRAYRRAVEAIERGGGRVLELRANFRSVPELVGPLNDLFASQFPPLPEGRRPCRPSGDGPAGAGPSNGGTAPVPSLLSDPGRDRREPVPPATPAGFDPAFAPLDAVRDPAGEPRIEIWSVGEGELKAPERRAAEASAIAARLSASFDAGEVSPGDVAILFRAMTGADTYLRALRARGIDAIVDGGKEFYRRHEVELLLTALRVFVNPSDEVSLVSLLRSPVCAVPDRELQAHAARPLEEGEARWSLAAKVDGKAHRALVRALNLLRDFRERHRNEPIDRVAWALLDETPLRLAMAASYGGGQRVANIEKAVRRIAELAADGRLDSGEILGRLEADGSIAVEEGDSPLADETVDAVRVLTIHKAKGLEWPVVILPDLAREERPPASVETVAAAAERRLDLPGEAPAPLPPALALRIGGATTPAFLRHREEEERHREAESRRLLYVAATRARERLVLVVGAQKGRESPWMGALGAWGYAIDGGTPPEARTLHGGAVLHERIPEGKAGRRLRSREAPDPRLLGAARAFVEATEGIADRAGGRILSPSGLAKGSDRAERTEDGEGIRGAEASGERALAMAAGTAVHLLLELWDRKDPRWLEAEAPRAATVAARGMDLGAEETGEVLARVRAILRRAADAGRISAIAAEPSLARELPLLLRDAEGNVWDGTVDLVAGAVERPRVVDYKTTVTGAAEEELLKAYEGQLELYAEGVWRAMGLADRPEVGIEAL